jgi:hypothetical protein
VSVDFFTVPTIRFQILYVFLVLAHDRRRILHFDVTLIPPLNGQVNSCEKPSRLTKFHVICCATATASSALTSPGTSSRKYSRRLGRLGRERMWSASSAAFVGSASII